MSLEDSYRQALCEHDLELLLKCFRIFAIVDQAKRAEVIFGEVLVLPFLAHAMPAPSELSRPAHEVSRVYEMLLGFFHSKCLPVLQAAESLGGFDADLYASVVGSEFLVSIQRAMPFLFSPGLPDAFFENYTLTMRFLSDFEQGATTRANVVRLREHPVYKAFMNRWPLSVYYQLRFKEIAVPFEDHLAFRADAVTSMRALLPATGHVMQRLQTVWSPSVFLPALAHRFFGMTLQMLERFAAWVGESFSSLAADPAAMGHDGRRRLSEATADDLEAALHADVVKAVSLYVNLVEVVEFARNHLDVVILPAVSPEPTLAMQLRLAFDVSLGHLQEFVPRVSHRIVGLYSEISTMTLAQVKNVTGQYRMTNRPAPSEPSSFIVNVFAPVDQMRRELLQVPAVGSDVVDADVVDGWVVAIVDKATSRYIYERSVTSVQETNGLPAIIG